MKICPKCHTQYEDTMSFCLKDGAQLVTETTAPATEVKEPAFTPEQPEPCPVPKKGSGCLKKIIIAAVVVIVGLVALYNYLMGAATYLRVEPNQLVATKGGGGCMVDVDYDGYIWQINHKPDWVEIDEHDRSLNVKVGPNTTGSPREGSITLQSGDHLAQIMIGQNHLATTINISRNKFSFDRSGGTKNVIIQTDGCNWDAQYTDWMTVTKEDGNTLRITCPANSGNYRTGTIKVYEDNVYTTLTVTQSGNCPTCCGAGELNCYHCGGTGQVGYGMYYSQCLLCGGNGKLRCSACSGKGYKE